MKRRIIASLTLVLFAFSGCTAYKSQYVSFRPPEGYLNYQVVDGVSLGAEAYAVKDDAEKAFGFDIKGAGLLPVQLVLDNRSGRNLELVPGQTFLVDNEGRYWNVVPNHVAIDRLEKSTQLASFFGKGAGKGALLGATGGAILGAAIGIVSGRNVGEAIGKGAVIGGAGGAIIGGAQEGTSGEREHTIIDDIRAKGLEGKVIPREHLANGFIFFPGEADSARELRLQYREKETGKLQSVVLRLK
ncbi:MAG: glycine zipper family protein [Geobacteraceae bacterium]|nr:glycine zipper family protein [Geobacteraceae bacterium]